MPPPPLDPSPVASPPQPMGGTPVREVLLLYAGVVLVTAVLGAASRVPALADVSALGIAVAFVAVPLWAARREANGAARYGIALGGLFEPAREDDERPAGPLGLFDLARMLYAAAPDGAREIAFALAVGAIVFPPFVVGFWAWHQPVREFTLTIPSDLVSFALTQLVVAGVPEEAFFRGLVQTRLGDAWTRTTRILGADVNLGALVAQAALFALVHLATEPRLDKLATFFPGLLFGWMRARRGGIGSPIVMHALSNVLAEILARGWLS